MKSLKFFQFPKVLGFVAPSSSVSPIAPAVPAVKKKDRAARIIDRAADIIEERGWTRGEMESVSGRVCALRAIQLASFGFVGFILPSAKKEAIQRIREHTGYGSVPQWNDDYYNNGIRVVQTLRKVASS